MRETSQTIRGEAREVRGSRISRRLAIRFLIAGLVLLFVVQRLLFTMPGRWEFALYQSRYARLVQKIKSLDIEPEKNVYLRVAPSLDPDSVRTPPREGSPDMAGKIAVRRSRDNHYQISVITQDQGHAGA